MTDLTPTYDQPHVQPDHTADGHPFNENDCGWNLAFDCNLSFGTDEDTGGLFVSVAVTVSEDDDIDAVTRRSVTPEQVVAFGHMLIALGGGRVEDEWCVWYGGDDPNECAGTLVYDDQASAEEKVQWIVGGRLARRSVHIEPWTAVYSNG